MTMKLTNTQLLLVVVGAFVVLLLLLRPCLMQEDFGADAYGEYMRGTHGEGSVGYSVEDNRENDGSDGSCCPKAAVNREDGYGSKYHIVGEKAYPCSNNPDDVGLYGCGEDDFSIWQDGTKCDFNHNPVYGYGKEGDCNLRTHHYSQNPYNYQDTSVCRCSANDKPRTSFDSDDPFTHSPRY